MKPRRFNSVMFVANHKWASNVLSMDAAQSNGIDLKDEFRKIGVELKFYLAPVNPSNKKWKVEERQIDYNGGKLRCYWGLGFYEMSKSVREIRECDSWDLEKFVTHRELFLIRWKWMEQFPPHETSGSTHISHWERTFRYPKYSDIPKVKKTYEVDKGYVHLTSRVPTGLFEEGIFWDTPF